MTVKELREKLCEFDDDSLVIIDSFCTPTSIVADNEHPGEVEIWYKIKEVVE